ncbi:MFS transporter [Candidatus Bathyarchaeota archaeon]|nr:MFS transporter [Candidatus Bathyarchaeota archaeon]
MPTVLTYFTELTPAQNRGKMSGIVFFATVISAISFIMVFQGLNLAVNATALAVWRGWSLIVLNLVPEQLTTSEGFSRNKRVYTSFLNRTFLLYFATWFMFTLVSGFGANIVVFYGGEYRDRFKLTEPAVAAFSGLISGIFCDWIGRKRVITFGFVSLGLAYAILGLAPEIWFSWLFFYLADGIALGILWVTLVAVLWGEISYHHVPKSYAIGEVPYFLTGIVSSILAPFTALIPRTSAFSLAAFFLFVAVIPLMYVPETLPEKSIKERELKIYVDKAKKIKQKYA